MKRYAALLIVVVSLVAAAPAAANISTGRAQANALDWGLHKGACYGVYWSCGAAVSHCNVASNTNDWRRARFSCHVWLLRSPRHHSLWRFLFGGGHQACAGVIALSPIGVRFSSIFRCRNGSDPYFVLAPDRGGTGSRVR